MHVFHQNCSAFKPGDCFVGYHSDTAAAVVMAISSAGNDEADEQASVLLFYLHFTRGSPYITYPRIGSYTYRETIKGPGTVSKVI